MHQKYQIDNDHCFKQGFTDSSVGKESTGNAGDPGLIPGSRRSTGEEIGYPLQYSWASLVAQLVKNLPAMQEILGLGRSAEEGIGYLLQYSWASPVKGSAGKGRLGFDPWVGKIPWRRERLPTPVFWPGEVHGLYSPWGCKELDTTERLSLPRTGVLSSLSPSGSLFYIV